MVHIWLKCAQIENPHFSARRAEKYLSQIENDVKLVIFAWKYEMKQLTQNIEKSIILFQYMLCRHILLLIIIQYFVVHLKVGFVFQYDFFDKTDYLDTTGRKTSFPNLTILNFVQGVQCMNFAT